MICRMIFTLSLVVQGIAWCLYAQSTAWQLAKDKDGIKVYTKKALGSDIKDSKAVLRIKTTPEKVLEQLLDFDAHKIWMDRVKESYLLKKINENEYIVYYEASAPWPVSNRDVISHYHVQKDADGTITILVTGEPDFIPEKEGIVRIRDQRTTWTIEPMDDGTVEVTYENHSDPAGRLPAWLANSASVDNPYNTLYNLRQILEGRD